MTHKKQKDLPCPRDHYAMREEVVGDATLDVCPKCHGQFFDSGEMFSAFGIKADPSYWDRPETGGTVKESDIDCARCHAHMVAQDVRYGDKHVEIDRCPHCRCIWLDKGEVDTIIAISDSLQSLVETEKATAAASTASLSEDMFAPGLIGKFLALFRKKEAPPA